MGNEAYDMFEKAPANIVVNSPMAFGMIANLELQEIALYSMMKKIDHFLGIGSDMFFSVPLDMTAVEKRAYYHVANGHWLRQNRVYMVEAPIADAIAMGVDLNRNAGSMIVNIGAQSTQFSIITDGKIIIAKKIPIGGRQMNEAICSEIRKRYNLQIGTRTGKRLKIAMGRLNDQRREARKVVGIDGISGLPREEIISGYVVNAGIMNCVNEIAAEMKTFLERTGFSAFFRMSIFWILPLSKVTATRMSPCLPTPTPSVVIGAAKRVVEAAPKARAAAIVIKFFWNCMMK